MAVPRASCAGEAAAAGSVAADLPEVMDGQLEPSCADHGEAVPIMGKQSGVTTVRVGTWFGIGIVSLVLLGALVWKVPEALAGPVPAVPALGARDAEIAASATLYAAYRADISGTRTGIIAGLRKWNSTTRDRPGRDVNVRSCPTSHPTSIAC